MPACLTELPNDPIHQIALYLTVRDYTNLSRTSRCFAQHLDDDGTARKVIKNNHAHSSAGQNLLNAGPQFRRQLSHLHDRREALRAALPYTISQIAIATSFTYTDGVLAYTTSDSIRLLDVSRASSYERVISNRFITAKLPSAALRASSTPPVCTVLTYKDSVLALLTRFGPVVGDYLIALDVSPGDVDQRCLLCERLRSTNKLFCIIGEGYLYYGTQSASSGQGYPEWLILGFWVNDPTTSANTHCRKPVSQAPLQLERLSGLDPFSTITFTIHQGRFIAVTNQTGFEAQEINWTSFYRYISFRLDDKNPDLSLWRVFRRQDHEGPINDTWTELKWTVDEATGELLLVEGRKEWLAGHEGSSRTWYSVLWDSPSIEHALWTGRPVSANPDDRLSALTAASNGGDGDKGGDDVQTPLDPVGFGRPARYCHHEYPLDGSTSDHNGEAREYIRAKTKFSSYDFNLGCAVELVVDDVPGEGWRTKERIRLRVVSRLGISPIGMADHSTSSRVIIQQNSPSCKDGIEGEGIKERYADSEIHLWPREEQDLPAELAELMCPAGRTGEVKGTLGEEGLVYSVGPPGRNGEKQLVFVCFDPSWGFEGMRRLDGQLARPRNPGGALCEEPTDVTTLGMTDDRELRDERTAKRKHQATTEDDAADGQDICIDANVGPNVKRQKSASPPEFCAADYDHEQGYSHNHSRHDSGIAMPSSEEDDDDADDFEDDTLNNDDVYPEQDLHASPSQHGDDGDDDSAGSTETEVNTDTDTDANPMLISEPAMYLALNRGFWVR